MESSHPKVNVSQAEIGNLVETFYSRVQCDEILGPVFNQAVADWPQHLALLKEFWSTVLLTTATYRGDPLAKHLDLPIDKKHFDRWLSLFAGTAHDVLSAGHAAQVILKSQQIARNFQRAISHKRSERMP